MTGFGDVLATSVDQYLEPVLAAAGYRRERRARAWTKDELQVRVVLDSKAADPYRGGAFTLEFEVSNDGHFERKLAGRARLDQLLDARQASAFLSLRNSIAKRWGTPPADHLVEIHESLQPEYLKAFAEAQALEPRFWMRFRTPDDAGEWLTLVVNEFPSLEPRARGLAPNELYLGKDLEW